MVKLLVLFLASVVYAEIVYVPTGTTVIVSDSIRESFITSSKIQQDDMDARIAKYDAKKLAKDAYDAETDRMETLKGKYKDATATLSEVYELVGILLKRL